MNFEINFQKPVLTQSWHQMLCIFAFVLSTTVIQRFSIWMIRLIYRNTNIIKKMRIIRSYRCLMWLNGLSYQINYQATSEKFFIIVRLLILQTIDFHFKTCLKHFGWFYFKLYFCWFRRENVEEADFVYASIKSAGTGCFDDCRWAGHWTRGENRGPFERRTQRWGVHQGQCNLWYQFLFFFLIFETFAD